MVFSWSTVMQAAQSFAGLTMTARPSIATGISMYSMPFCAQSSISSPRIGREAPVMSVSPRQNFLKPPPVPDRPTVTRVPVADWNSSAIASEMGNTVEDPSTVTVAASCAVA